MILTGTPIQNEFQFTPLREGRRETPLIVLYMVNFNSRPSARGDVPLHFQQNAILKFQFTPLREGRHDGVRLVLAVRPISIHAPPRGATALQTGDFVAQIISIHAPPRGATCAG